MVSEERLRDFKSLFCWNGDNIRMRLKFLNNFSCGFEAELILYISG